jgi:drug/metabolite transporter (DMT)-like permease
MSNALLYAITFLIWGSTWLAITFQLGVVPPELSVAYRFALASLILLGYSLYRGLSLRFTRRQHFYIALQGIFLFCLNYILVYYSEGFLKSGLVAVVFSSIVIMNVVFGALFLRAPVRAPVVVGGLVGTTGLMVAFWPELSSFDLTSDRALGLVFAILATLSASLGNIISARNQKAALPVIQTNAIGMGYGALLMFLFAFMRGVPLTFEPSPPYVISLLYLALFGSVFAFGAYLTLLGRIGADRASYVTVVYPIFALILSTLYEDLDWTINALMGTLLIVLGNMIVLTRKRRRRDVPVENQPARD